MQITSLTVTCLLGLALQLQAAELLFFLAATVIVILPELSLGVALQERPKGGQSQEEIIGEKMSVCPMFYLLTHAPSFATFSVLACKLLKEITLPETTALE